MLHPEYPETDQDKCTKMAKFELRLTFIIESNFKHYELCFRGGFLAVSDIKSESNSESSSSSSGSLGHDVKQCVVEYVKNTPVGCDLSTPDVADIDLAASTGVDRVDMLGEATILLGNDEPMLIQGNPSLQNAIDGLLYE